LWQILYLTMNNFEIFISDAAFIIN